jgi:putative ABC transport system permease protein
MHALLQDLRYAIRSLRRTPGFTLAAVLTLALGIGANTAIFSIVDGVLLRPAPIDDVDRVMMVWETDRKSGTTREPSSLPDFLDFQQRSETFAHLAAFTSVDVNLTPEGGEAERLVALGVTDGFAQTLGVTPIAGRLLEERETRPGGPRSVLVSENLANRLFAGAHAAIGKTLRLGDIDWTIVGVLPAAGDFGMRQILADAAYGRGFAERTDRARVDVWIGLRADVKSLPRDTHPIFVFGRLAAGATAAQAHSEMTQITADLEKAYPENAARGAYVEPLARVVFGDVRPALLTLLAAVALVLLVACANVANLLLVRAASRMREVTVRVALGAGMARLAQQFLVEGAVLTTLGAALGVFLAFIGMDVLRSMAPPNLPRIDLVAIDGRVLAITLAVTALVALAFGILPTLHARRRQLHTAMRGGAGRGMSAGSDHRRFRGALIVSELAMASMLMIGAGLLIKSLWRLENVDTGFAAAGVLKGEYNLPSSRYPRSFAKFPHWVEQQQFDDALLARLAALPGVEAVALASNHPLDAGFTSSISVVGREAEAHDWPEPSIRIVSAGYFATMRLNATAGRLPGSSDDANAPPVILVNEAARQRFFGKSDPINHQIGLWGAKRTVIGVVANERFKGLASDASPAVYLPISQVPPNGGHSVLLRVRGEPSAFAAGLRSAVRSIDGRLPLFGVEPLPETLSKSIAQQRFTMVVLGAFALVALLLAAVGVHGVLSYTVSQRTSEIGIRMALGADGHSVRSLVLGEGATLAVIGLAIGLVGAFAVSRLLSNLLFGVGVHDPLTFAAVAAALASVAMLATYLPARRASRVDPMVALRNE